MMEATIIQITSDDNSSYTRTVTSTAILRRRRQKKMSKGQLQKQGGAPKPSDEAAVDKSDLGKVLACIDNSVKEVAITVNTISTQINTTTKDVAKIITTIVTDAIGSFLVVVVVMVVVTGLIVFGVSKSLEWCNSNRDCLISLGYWPLSEFLIVTIFMIIPSMSFAYIVKFLGFRLQ